MKKTRIARWRNRSPAWLLFLLWNPGAALAQRHVYLGFDRNDYPGDAALPALRRSFRYSGYWLNAPPGETATNWAGKRTPLRKQGFGFLALWNGRADAELKGRDAAALGAADGTAAVAAAVREGFPPHVLIFLDQEEGGRLLAEQSAYIWAWADAVRAAGARAGVYCSAIDVPEGAGTISTARDLLAQAQARKTPPPALWVANDQCPPAPGCARTDRPPSDSGVREAEIWQYAQSPRRTHFSAGCPKNAASDGNCYAPGLPDIFLDWNTASSPDPSGGRD